MNKYDPESLHERWIELEHKTGLKLVNKHSNKKIIIQII